MLPQSEANRLLARFQKERRVLASKLGGERRAYDHAWEQAQHASEYILGAARLFSAQAQPLPLETRIQSGAPDYPHHVQVRMLLDGEDIGGFWVHPDNCWFHYYVVGVGKHAFPKALQILGNYIARKASYYHLLSQRAQPFNELLADNLSRMRRYGALSVETGYAGHKNWDVRQDYRYIRLAGEQKSHTLRIFGDRYNWGESYKVPLITLLGFEEMLGHIHQEMGA